MNTPSTTQTIIVWAEEELRGIRPRVGVDILCQFVGALVAVDRTTIRLPDVADHPEFRDVIPLAVAHLEASERRFTVVGPGLLRAYAVTV